MLLALFARFPLFFFLELGPNRIFHCALYILGIFAVVFHLSKEYRRVHECLSAVALVTD